NVLDFGVQIPLYEGVGKPFEKLFQTHRNHLLTKYSSYQTRKMNTHHSWRQLSRLPERCWSSILLSAAVLKNFSDASEAKASRRLAPYSSSRSQARTGTGKPRFFLSAVVGGIVFSAAPRIAILVWAALTLQEVGMRQARSKTLRSRKGTRSSSEFAMLILSALSRISPTIQRLRSQYSIRVTASWPRVCSKYGRDRSVGKIRPV